MLGDDAAAFHRMAAAAMDVEALASAHGAALANTAVAIAEAGLHGGGDVAGALANARWAPGFAGADGIRDRGQHARCRAITAAAASSAMARLSASTIAIGLADMADLVVARADDR